ncbi:MAG: hypothetical protein BWX80_03235 [Candidatus Hydrogenedentes bacterium ADurb.Bin101]|nr:MAG: hypothetical protein BWX80_03235 [Candidatus Hydrogenedentes bacterium ADurb.Bin101]
MSDTNPGDTAKRCNDYPSGSQMEFGNQLNALFLS